MRFLTFQHRRSNAVGLAPAQRRGPARPDRSYDQPILDWSQCHAVERSPAKVSGAWVFNGTRVPVKALFENLEDGTRVDDFVEWFPGVTREQVEAVLSHAERSLAA